VATVADSGAGIDPSIVDRIFEPFWTTRAAGEGTGLGLSIAKQIVEEHGGSIRVAPSTLGGALFTLRIPLSQQKTQKPS
jgi:signal transduction histidine kinase